LRGLRELKRVSQSGGTLLVISDGHVNRGVTDRVQLAGVAGRACTDRIVTSTLGYGHGYDESLLSAIARSGSGNHVFAADPDAAGAAIASEVDGLLDKVVQAASLTISFEPAVSVLHLYNDLPTHQLGDGSVVVELGDFFSTEQRRLLFKLRVPALASLGLAQIATLRVQYVEIPNLLEHAVTVPIAVNVVPGDEARSRLPDPTVHSERLFQEAQDRKKQASEAFERGDLPVGRRLLGEAASGLDEALGVAPAAAADSIRAEREDVRRMSSMTGDVGTTHMSKLLRESHHRANRKRGRRPDERG
jgi:Ca-activated chloride channel family protein